MAEQAKRFVLNLRSFLESQVSGIKLNLQNAQKLEKETINLGRLFTRPIRFINTATEK